MKQAKKSKNRSEAQWLEVMEKKKRKDKKCQKKGGKKKNKCGSERDFKLFKNLEINPRKTEKIYIY